MADRGGQNSGGGVPISALIIAIVLALILGVLLIVVWFQLQNCIKEQRNNIPPQLNFDPNAT